MLRNKGIHNFLKTHVPLPPTHHPFQAYEHSGHKEYKLIAYKHDWKIYRQLILKFRINHSRSSRYNHVLTGKLWSASCRSGDVGKGFRLVGCKTNLSYISSKIMLNVSRWMRNRFTNSSSDHYKYPLVHHIFPNSRFLSGLFRFRVFLFIIIADTDVMYALTANFSSSATLTLFLFLRRNSSSSSSSFRFLFREALFHYALNPSILTLKTLHKMNEPDSFIHCNIWFSF